MDAEPSILSDVSTQQRIEARVRARLFAATPVAARIGRYLVLESIARGGMGMVYAAYDDQLDRKVAVKVLLDNELPGEDDRQRFIREARALARLSHPHVVTVHEVGESEGQVFLAMEFVRGQSLSVWLGTKPDWPQVLDAFMQAGQGLMAAHEAGLVHRDLKPANIIRGDDGMVKVLDFGVAQMVAQALGESDEWAQTARSAHLEPSLVTRTGAMLGTPAYMAPEQLTEGQVDARSDQYGFCVSLWGSRPRDSNTAKLHAFSRKRLGSRGFLGVCDASGVPWGLGSSAVLVETAWRRTRCAPTWSRPVTSEVTTSGSKAAANQRTRAATSAGIVPTAIPAARPSIPPTPIAMHPIAPVSAASRAAGKSSATYPEGWARTARRPTSRPPSNAAAPTMGMHHAVHAGPPQACGMWQALSPTTMGSEPATSPGTMARLHARPW